MSYAVCLLFVVAFEVNKLLVHFTLLHACACNLLSQRKVANPLLPSLIRPFCIAYLGVCVFWGGG